MRACLQVFARTPVDRQSVASALANAGVVLTPASEDAPKVPRLVFFDAPSVELTAFLETGSALGQERIVAVATSRSGLDGVTPWRLLAAGASDVVMWERPNTAEHIAARLVRWAAIDEMVDAETARGDLVGRSPAWRSALRRIVELAVFTDSSVLLTGESGTGKELVARLIHRLDARKGKRDLVVVDCTTVVPSLSGSEFFGHEKGSFTGAASTRDGAFAAADQGTLFLDEVGELPLPLQAELLRVVQEGMYKRVGSNVWRQTTFRLISATNRNLDDEQAGGRFRRDFYYRIAAAMVRLPRLESRPEDIVPLFRHFLGQLSEGGTSPLVDEAVSRVLVRRRYPGNVRDLRQLAVRVSSRHVGPGPITVGDLPEEERPPLEAGQDTVPVDGMDGAIRPAVLRGASLREVREAAADAAIRIAVELSGNNLRAAASMLGVTDRALQLRRAAHRRSSLVDRTDAEEVAGTNGHQVGADA